MARHVYGYTKIFDGDADPERPDHYIHTANTGGVGLNGDIPPGGGGVVMTQYSASGANATTAPFSRNV